MAIKAPKVTYKQEGGDDGYCYVVRVDGKVYTAGCMRSEAQGYKRKILNAWAAKHKVAPAQINKPSAKAAPKRMPKAELDALIAKLRGPMRRTFEVTAHDLEEACRSCGEKLTNEGAVESCLDGGGLMGMYGGAEGKECEALLDAASKNGTYMQVFRAVCKQIILV